ncbi:MAG: acylphosphatase [Patescibacteria group bacterium]|nr:acylphosphatase [Patescibacteria group bacterium]
MKKHLSIKVFGDVQGVIFRASAERLAKKLGITGFARNEPDESVYIEAEGEELSLQEFVRWCRQGPDFSKVRSIETKEGELKNFTDFRIS